MLGMNISIASRGLISRINRDKYLSGLLEEVSDEVHV
jgi:hypothetical protein